MNCNVDVQFQMTMVDFQILVQNVFSIINNVPGEGFYNIFQNIKPKYTRTLGGETIVLSIFQNKILIYGYNKTWRNWKNLIGFGWGIDCEYVDTQMTNVTFRTFEHFTPEVFRYVIGYSTHEEHFKPHVFS